MMYECTPPVGRLLNFPVSFTLNIPVDVEKILLDFFYAVVGIASISIM